MERGIKGPIGQCGNGQRNIRGQQRQAVAGWQRFKAGQRQLAARSRRATALDAARDAATCGDQGLNPRNQITSGFFSYDCTLSA